MDFYPDVIEMKSLTTILFVFTISMCATAQVAKPQVGKQTQTVKKVTVKSTPLPADDKDPVCYMKVKKGTLITTSYKGKLYGFCSEHCKGVFLADPTAQLK